MRDCDVEKTAKCLFPKLGFVALFLPFLFLDVMCSSSERMRCFLGGSGRRFTFRSRGRRMGPVLKIRKERKAAPALGQQQAAVFSQGSDGRTAARNIPSDDTSPRIDREKEQHERQRRESEIRSQGHFIPSHSESQVGEQTSTTTEQQYYCCWWQEFNDSFSHSLPQKLE